MKKILKFIGLYNILRKIKRQYVINKKTKGKHIFENRKKDMNKMCIILAGYKPFLYDVIFKRIKKFIPNDIDVCIVSSGIYDKQLSKIAESNNWSYLSVKKNCVTLSQNMAISLFEKAKYIYKLDEDIFVTKNYFETLMKTYKDCIKNGCYKVGFVAPLIPVNGYGNYKILERFDCLSYYENNYEKPLFATGRDRMVENNPEVAKFFWGEKNKLPHLDEMNKIVNKDNFSYNACPIRFSIGAILFKRETWEDFGMFEVQNNSCMGLDEGQFCNYCMDNSKAIIVSNNVVVGHLSFGNQNKPMKKYFLSNKKKFEIKGGKNEKI